MLRVNHGLKCFFIFWVFVLNSPKTHGGELALDEAILFAGYLSSIGEVNSAEGILVRLNKVAPFPTVKFALANVLYKQGKVEAADKIVDGLIVEGWRYPELVEKLKQIKKRNSLWRPDWSYAFSSMRTRNPNKRAKSGTYNLLGLEMNFTNPEDKNYWGIYHDFRLRVRLPYQSRLEANYKVTDYEGSFADRQNIKLDYISRVFEGSNLEPFFRLEGNWQKNYDDFSVSAGVRNNLKFRNGRLNISASVGKVEARQNKSASGDKVDIEAGFSPFTYRVRQKYFVYFSNFNLDGDHLRHHLNGVGASFQHSIGNYFGSLHFNYFERSFKNVDPFWNAIRHDQTTSGKLEVCRGLSSRFALCGNAGRENRASNIEFFENDSPQVGFYFRGYL